MAEFLTLVFVALLAFLAPAIARQLKAPVVVAEIMLGMAVGLGAFIAREYFHTTAFETGEAVAFLAEIGFIILLFLAGLEIDFNKIEDRGPAPILLGLLIFALTLGIAYAIVSHFGYGFFAALVLSTTSVGIVVPTLREARLAQSTFGQTVIITALIADFGTMILLTIWTITNDPGTALAGGVSVPSGTTSWLPFPAEYLLLPAFFLVFYLVYRFGGWMMWQRPDTLSRFFRKEDPMERGVRGSLALMFVFVALSEILGIEVILGSFLAGTLISLLFRQSTLLDEKLYGIGYGFFVPIFFIHLGMNFNWLALADREALVLLPLLVLSAFAIKVLPSLVLVPKYGIRKVLAIGALNSARLTLMIAAASIGLEFGILDETLYTAVIILAMVTSSLGPVLFRLLTAKDTNRQAYPGTAEPEGGALYDA